MQGCVSANLVSAFPPTNPITNWKRFQNHSNVTCDNFIYSRSILFVLSSMKRKKSSSFDKVVNSIVQVREPGEQPRESLFGFDEFECDLCKGIVPRKKLTQCAFCGRWICKDRCWNSESMSCVSCAGVIKLSKESVDIESDDMDDNEGERVKRTGMKSVLRRVGKRSK